MAGRKGILDLTATGLTRRTALKGLAAAGGLMAAPGFVRYAQSQSAAPIKIGFQAHRTGIGAAYGRWYEKTTNAAIKAINDAGGINCRPVEVIVEDDGTIVAVDLGIAGRLGKKERRFLAEILYGFITRDYLRVAEVHFEAGYVPHKHDVAAFAQAIRAIGEPIHGQPAETISMAKLLTLLFEVTELFDMETRPELVLLQKTMVVVEGVARTLDPGFNMWKTSEPVVGDWIASNLGPRGMLADAREGMGALLTLMRHVPDMAVRAERLSREIDTMVENGLRFEQSTAEAIGKASARYSRLGHWALWIMALTLIYIAWKLA